MRDFQENTTQKGRAPVNICFLLFFSDAQCQSLSFRSSKLPLELVTLIGLMMTQKQLILK